MADWVVRVEAVNFGATILDTNDLSTVRGGGLACLLVQQPVMAALASLKHVKGAPRLIYSGASQCAFLVEADQNEATISAEVEQAVRAQMRAATGAGKEAPHGFMMHVVDTVKVAESGRAGEVEQALREAEARNRSRQFRQWTQSPTAFSAFARNADPSDGVSPATVRAYYPKGRSLQAENDDGVPSGKDFEVRLVAPSVKARRDFGRKARQEFYAHFLKSDLHHGLSTSNSSFGFAQSFQDIVADPPAGPGLSVRNKIAVVYADGNGFGKVREQVGTESFARQLELHRNALLKAMTDWLVAGASGELHGAFATARTINERPVGSLRFETILWGGDEMAFVMPAWLATAFVEGFFRHTGSWRVVDEKTQQAFPLTHAAGVAIAHVKVPIRQLRTIAKDAADGAKTSIAQTSIAKTSIAKTSIAKTGGVNAVNSATFEIFESLHPPDSDLDRWRKSLFGAQADEAELSRALALPGDNFAEVLDRFDRIVRGRKDASGVGAGFPRSQLYSVLRELRSAGRGLGEAGADKDVEAVLDTYLRRAGMDRGFSRSDLSLPAIGGTARGLAMTLGLIATLWDYADPFAGALPKFGASAGARP